MNDKNLILRKQTLIDIANAIRKKTGSTNLIKISDLDDAVANLQGGESGDGVLIEYGGKTVVPNTGYVEKLYCNTNLNEEEVLSLLNSLTYDMSGYGVVVSANEDNSKSIMILNSGNMVIILNGNFEIYWANEAGASQLGLTQAGWQEFNNPIEINSEVLSVSDGLAVGEQNDLLTNLFSITSFEKITKTLSGTYDGEPIMVVENGTVDISALIDEKKIPLNINVDTPDVTVGDKILTGDYDGTSINIGKNGVVDISSLIDQKKIPLGISVNVLPETENVDTVALYRETRDNNWPSIPLPSEIAETSTKDTVYLLYDAGGLFVCPAFNLTYDGVCLLTIEKYMNTTLVSSETLTDVTSKTDKYLQYDYTDEDWDSYNYLLIKIEMQGDSSDSANLNNLIIRKPIYNNITIGNNDNSSPNELLEISGNCVSCSVRGIANYSKKLKYFSFLNCSIGKEMFYNCSSLITLPEFSSIYQENYLTDFSHMFDCCYALQSVPSFDTSNVTNMSNMFEWCYSLQSVPLFDTSNVTDMSYMFNCCYALQSVPSFDTSNVTDMTYMFDCCYALQSVPLFDTSSVTNMSHMFNGCRSLQTVPLFDTSSVTNMSNMFYWCYALQSVPSFDTSNVTNMSHMFDCCYALQSVPLFDTSSVTDMTYMLYSCGLLQSVPLFDTSNVTDMTYTVVGCYSLQTVPQFDTSNATSIELSSCYSLKSIPQFDISNATKISLNSCYSLQTVPSFDTSNVTNIILTNCYSLIDINMYNMKVKFDLSKSTLLTREAIVKVLNNLATITSSQTLTLGSTNLAKLTAEDKLIATNKGWTLA